MPPALDPRDEYRHAPGTDRLWQESWYFDFHDAAGTLGGYVRIGRYPNLGQVWYWACVVGEDRPLVTVIDHTATLPADPSRSVELRTEGLWADHNVEEPFERFSLGLEAFAVALDDPGDVYRGAYGDRIPFGFELEWETDGEVFPYPEGLDRYEIPCRVHGELLIGRDETIEFDGFGQRDHSWGPRDWWAMAWCWTSFRLDDGTRIHAVTTLPAFWCMGYVQAPDSPMVQVGSFDVTHETGVDDIPTHARLVIEGRGFEFEPVAWSPVLLEADDGRIDRFPRAMVRVRADDGTTGVGWIEFNQPQGI